MKKFLKDKTILEVERNSQTDMAKITYLTKEGHAWVNIQAKDAERLNLLPNTKRYHKKSRQLIRKQNLILLILQIIPILLFLGLSVYGYMTKNVVGLGVSMGITIALLLKLLLDRNTTDLYEYKIKSPNK